MSKGGYQQREEGAPSDNLYICGLPEQFDTDSVQQFFAAIGNVMQCKAFGNGFALVRFSSEPEATTVKNSLNGQMPIGCVKPLVITYATTGKKDDWTCPRCGDLQFQKNTECRKCGCPKSGEAVTPGSATFATQLKFGLTMHNKTTPCKFWLQGTCQKGSMCTFSHDESGGGSAVTQRFSPYGDGQGKGTGKIKGGPMSSIEDFIAELITGGLPGGDFDPMVNCVWVSGLPPDCGDQNLYEIFATFGAVPPKGARIDADPTGACTGSGFVNFVDSECADMAVMALNGIPVADGRKLEVKRK